MKDLLEVPQIKPQKVEQDIMLPEWMTDILNKPLSKTKTDTQKEYWVTAAGERLLPRDMETRHIQNCIRCLRGQGKMRIPEGYLGGKEKWLKIFEEELSRR